MSQLHPTKYLYMSNLTGTWAYNEEFDYGFSKGTIILIQKVDKLGGTAILTEINDDETSFKVKIKIEGLVEDKNVVFKGIHFEVLSDIKNIDYYLDTWEGVINSQGDIVGNLIDQSGTCGVFKMSRIDE